MVGYKPTYGLISRNGVLRTSNTLDHIGIFARKVEDVIENYEPRARLVGVTATPNLDRNEYNITIHFYVVNAPTELVEFDVLLERLR